ncbi:hypothetical protein ACFL4W_04635 [Planctomycetota bacterium]
MRTCLCVLTIAAAMLFVSCGKKSNEGEKADTPKPAAFKLKEKAEYAPGEKEAGQVLAAYITKDLALLKKYASGMLKNTLDEKAMERPNDRERIESWDGEIKAMRYGRDEINFETVYYAYACYKGDPATDEKVYTVTLKSKDRTTWAISINPLGSMKSADFNGKSNALPEAEEEE